MKIVKFEKPASKEFEENKKIALEAIQKAKKFLLVWDDEDSKPYAPFNYVSGGTVKGEIVYIGAYLQHEHLKEIFESEEEDE